MIKEKVFIGAPINYKQQFYIYPPLIKDIINNDNFYSYVGLLTKTQEDLDDFYLENDPDIKKIPTPFEFLLISAYYDKKIEQLIKDAWYFFIHEPITFLYDAKIIIVGNLENNLSQIHSIDELILIKEEDYFDFQNILRITIGMDPVELPDPDESEGIKHIKAQNRKRERLKAKNKKGISLSTSLAAICCMNIGINPLNIGELSYAAFQQLIMTYQKKESYELDINALLAGADSKKVKPKYWISENSNLIDIQI